LATKRKSEAAMNVDEFLQKLDHSRIDEIRQIRAMVLSVDENITEQIKWNAPSFCVAGDDRITFRLQPGDRVQLVFHRGAKKRTDADTFSFEDHTGLLEWAAKDRATITFANSEDVTKKSEALRELVAKWIAATS